MVRRHVASDAQSATPRLANSRKGSGRRGVRHMQMNTGHGPRSSVTSRMSRSTSPDSASAGIPRSPSLERHRPRVHACALRETCILGVLNHAQTYARRSGQRLAH